MTQWRKSSRSQGGEGECVELSTGVAEATLVRDSKNPDGPRLALGRPQLARLLGQVKAGQYDR